MPIYSLLRSKLQWWWSMISMYTAYTPICVPSIRKWNAIFNLMHAKKCHCMFRWNEFYVLSIRPKCFSPSLKLFTEKRFSPQISQHKHYLFVYGHMCMWNFYVKKLDRRIHDFCSFNEYVCLAFNIVFSYKNLLLTVKSIFPLQSFHRGLLDVVG